jgi:hypothetical protein
MSKLSLKQLIKLTITASKNWSDLNDLDNDWRGLTPGQKKKMDMWEEKEEKYADRAKEMLVEMGVIKDLEGAGTDADILALQKKMKELGFDSGYAWHFGNGDWC